MPAATARWTLSFLGIAALSGGSCPALIDAAGGVLARLIGPVGASQQERRSECHAGPRRQPWPCSIGGLDGHARRGNRDGQGSRTRGDGQSFPVDVMVSSSVVRHRFPQGWAQTSPRSTASARVSGLDKAELTIDGAVVGRVPVSTLLG